MIDALAPADVDRLRASVQRAEARTRRPATTAMRYVGGPLDGLSGNVDAYTARCLYLGWCIVTATGPVTALYSPAEPGRWAFVRLNAGPR